MIQTIPENEFMQVALLWREYAASHECYDRAYTLRPLSDEELLIYLSSEWATGGHHLSAKRIGRIHVRMSADNDKAIAFWRKSGFSDFVLTMKYQTEPSDASQL